MCFKLDRYARVEWGTSGTKVEIEHGAKLREAFNITSDKYLPFPLDGLQEMAIK